MKPASADGADSRQLVAVAVAQVAAMTVWFSATAVLPALREVWGLGDLGAAWVTGAVQAGFALGALASGILQLADRFDARWLFAVCAFGAAVCNVVLATVVDAAVPALLLRFVTGMLLAGVYPPGMKLAASHAPSSVRGLAIGALVGALTLGSALPHLLRVLAGDGGEGSAAVAMPWREVLFASAVASALAGVLVVGVVRIGPFASRPAPFAWRRVRDVFADRRLRMLNASYCGHMWELYAMWTWLAVWLGAVVGDDRADYPVPLGVIAFLGIGVAGAIGAVVAGVRADRVGRRRVATAAMVVSGACCCLSPFVPSTPWLLIAFVCVWGATVIADSAQLSAATTEACAPDAMGTALTLQTFLGFSLTMVSIQGVPIAAEWVGWRAALAMLAVGPLLGALAFPRGR